MTGLTDYIEKIKDFKSLKSSEQVDFFAYYLSIVLNENYFSPSQIQKAFEHLRLSPYSNIPKYLIDNSNNAKKKKKTIKYLKGKEGYHLESNFEDELRKSINIEEEASFIDFDINQDKLDCKPSDIPFTNTKIRKNAKFFTTLYFLLYHLENSIRKFLINRLTAIIGSSWEVEICAKVELGKAQSIKAEVNLSEMLPDRGDNILFYCMWDDYAKIIVEYPQVFSKPKEASEILAHLNSLAKVRNAIAHNASTIPKEYQDELTIFIKKYIKILENN